jgi:hypothetical protein
MNDIYDNFGRPDLPPAESRLETETILGPLNYPDDLVHRDQYFRDGLTLLREIPNQTEKLRTVITSYIKYATDPALRTELETFLQSLSKSDSANLARPGAAQ